MLLPNNIDKIKKEDFKHTIHSLNISFTNKKRISINKMMMSNYVKAKKTKGLQLSKLSYDDNSQDVEILAGMPIMARKNSKSLNIFNNETFRIKEIRKKSDIIVIEDEDRCQEIPIKDFQHLFYIAFCITCHKSQGCTFDENYTIHEFDRYDNRLKYVALSRAVNINLINIV
jgi:ATP-dependent exoDNAse (exonuclease V) alpha subunit